jgi:regulator of protease activity HflC (stomatin/prohibitin superfamily)
MKADKQKRAATFKSQGNAEGQRILAEAEYAAQRIRAVVQRKVNDIESEGLTEVGKIYSEFTEHQELRIFLDELRAMENILKERVTIFMDTNFRPMNLWDPKTRIGDSVPELPGPAKVSADTPATAD